MKYLEYLQYLRYASFAFNGIVLIIWLKSKMILKDFLQGLWKGNLIVKDDKEYIIECTLLVVKHKDRNNSALLYYERRRLACGTVTVRGVDKLEKYPDEKWFFWHPCWRPIFQRKAHVPLVEEEGMSAAESLMPKRYQWKCEITRRFFRPKMNVIITHEECVFEGELYKH
ncbi:MAG TPA: hypothetical protein VF791_10110 [Pyrinomonadaceae bacterium]